MTAKATSAKELLKLLELAKKELDKHAFKVLLLLDGTKQKVKK